MDDTNTASVIQKEHLTDEICANYTSAVWNSEPHVGPSTIRGNQSSIFHAAFINLGIKSMKDQPENFIETIKTLKGIKHDNRWKRYVVKKANIFTVKQILYLKNLPEEYVEVHVGKVLLVTTVDCGQRFADIIHIYGCSMVY